MTYQIRDTLTYKEKEYRLNVEILDRYFDEFPERKPKISGAMSACWRGYIADFEVVNNELVFLHLDLLFAPKGETARFFENNFPDKKYSWFSGLIRIDDFRGDFDDEDNEDAIYELLEFSHGNLVNYWKLNYTDYHDFKAMILADFKDTPDYKKQAARWKKNNPGITKAEIEKIILEDLIWWVREL